MYFCGRLFHVIKAKEESDIPIRGGPEKPGRAKLVLEVEITTGPSTENAKMAQGGARA